MQYICSIVRSAWLHPQAEWAASRGERGCTEYKWACLHCTWQPCCHSCTVVFGRVVAYLHKQRLSAAGCMPQLAPLQRAFNVLRLIAGEASSTAATAAGAAAAAPLELDRGNSGKQELLLF